jgi:multidrug efflux system membrane fusion protein
MKLSLMAGFKKAAGHECGGNALRPLRLIDAGAAQTNSLPYIRFVGCLGVILAGLLMSGCAKPAEVKPAPPVAPVMIGEVVQKTVPLQIRAIGNVQAYSNVSIKAQINGEVIKVKVKEGQDVKKGDLLFEIDPRPFQAAISQAEANLAKDVAAEKQAQATLKKDLAQSKNAQVEADRFVDLQRQGVVAKEQYDQRRTTAESMDATVSADKASIQNAEAAQNADKAAIETAKLQLAYCYIKSPMNGRLGSILLYPGNLVKANDTTALITINQITPIYVTFSVPEQNIAETKRYMAMGQLRVDALVPQEPANPRHGTLSFVDNAVDQNTGTIQLKATFPNQDRALWPGQFVNVVVTLTNESDMIVAPSQSVQNGQGGQYVFVVKSDLTVEPRPVKVTRSTDTEAVISEGLTPGEKVVIDGQLRLFAGARVEIKNPPATAKKENGQ